MNPSHDPKRIKEPSMMEGREYLAKIVVCPWAYRKIPGHKSTVGKIVRVKLGGVVSIEWESGNFNGTDRSHIRVLGEAPSRPRKKGKQ